MSVAYTSYEAAVVGYAIAMLVGSATFRQLVGADTPTQAKAFVIEFDGGDPREVGAAKAIASDGSTMEIRPPYAQVASTEFDADDTQAYGWVKRSGEVQIAITMPAVAGDTPAERIRRALNIIGGIRADIEGQFGQAGTLALGSVASRLMPLPDETGALRGTTAGQLTIHWRNA